MKKALLIIGLTFYFFTCTTIIFAQIKPVAPVLQPGWSTNCVRALLLNEGTGTSLTDMSGTAAVSLNLAAWSTDSEGPYFDGDGTQYISLNTGLPGASISTYTWYLRIKWSGNGAFLGLAATFTGGGLSDVMWYDPPSTDEPQFLVKNGSGTCATCNPAAIFVDGQKYNLVGTYDGSNVKAYVNGALVCTAALTGNIANDGYTTRIGHALQGGAGETGNCDGTSALQRIKVYATCVWQRVLTAAEISQIEKNPYVMFGGVNRPQSVQ